MSLSELIHTRSYHDDTTQKLDCCCSWGNPGWIIVMIISELARKDIAPKHVKKAVNQVAY